MMNANFSFAYRVGWDDGNTIARESGSAEEPMDGWSGYLINAMGPDAAREALGLDPNLDDDDPAWLEALEEYDHGAEDGADAALAEGSD